MQCDELLNCHNTSSLIFESLSWDLQGVTWFMLFTLEKFQGWNNWTIKGKYQLSTINHKKEKRARREGPPVRRSHCWAPERVYLSHKEILDKSRRYKRLATSYSFEVDDSQEIQERKSPEGSSIWLLFTDRWVPHLSDRH
jgi:hypothetical protein